MLALLLFGTAAPACSNEVAQLPAPPVLVWSGTDLRSKSPTYRQREVLVVGQGLVDDKPAAGPDRSWARGKETATRPWSAPVGHHQPRAADVPVPPAALQQMIEDEDARIDRIVRSICRGC